MKMSFKESMARALSQRKLSIQYCTESVLNVAQFELTSPHVVNLYANSMEN